MRWGNLNLIPTQHMPGHPGHPGAKEADQIWFGKDRTSRTMGAVHAYDQAQVVSFFF